MARYRLDDITLDTTRRSISKGGRELRVGKLTYELLALLVETAPAVLSQDQIAQRLWRNGVATPETIRQRVKLLRRALGDDPEGPHYIGVVHGQGYRLLPAVEDCRDEPVRSFGVAIWLAAACVAIGAIGVAFLPGSRPAVPPPVESPFGSSIAVLSFGGSDTRGVDRTFVDALRTALVTNLGKVGVHRVVSGDSVRSYDPMPRDIPQVAAELGVTMVLEGIVQRSGSGASISLNLIDGASAQQLWSASYDVPDDAEALLLTQSAMLTAIATALDAEISRDEYLRLVQPPTRDARAHHLYLIGVNALRNADNRESFLQAADAFEQAVEQDPKFALAWAMLSRTQSALYFFVDRTQSRLEQARASLERAFAIDPDLPEAFFAEGYLHYHGSRNYQAALEAWDRAEDGMPGSAELLLARAYLARRMGDWRAAIKYFDRAIALDPRNLEQLGTQAITYAQLRDYQTAEAVIDRMIAIAPDHAPIYVSKATLALWRGGDTMAVRDRLEAAPMAVEAPMLLWNTAIYDRDYRAALSALDDWQADALEDQWAYRPRAWFYGVTHALAGDADDAKKYFSEAQATLQTELERRPSEPRRMIALADTLACQGDTERALELVARARSLFPTSLDAAAAPNVHLDAIMVLVTAGAYDAAIDALDIYLAQPAVWSIDALLPNPRLDPIRDEPQFIALIEKYGQAG